MSMFSMNPKDYIRVVQTVYNGHGDKTWTLVAKDGTAAELWNTLPCGFSFGKLKEEKHGDKTVQVLDCGAFDPGYYLPGNWRLWDKNSRLDARLARTPKDKLFVEFYLRIQELRAIPKKPKRVRKKVSK